MPQEQGTSEIVSKDLSAREIFNRITKGEVVRIPNDPALASQLKNHLNVIKSREKKLFDSLDLDFLSTVIRVNPVFDTSEADTEYYEISLIAPKKRKKYPTFSLPRDSQQTPPDEPTSNNI